MLLTPRCQQAGVYFCKSRNPERKQMEKLDLKKELKHLYRALAFIIRQPMGER